jgi:Beta-lactamase enzyme family
VQARALALLAVPITAGAITAGAAPVAERPARLWHPGIWRAERYAAHRHGVIAFSVRTRTRTWSWHATTSFPSASVVKAMLLVAYLDRPSVRARRLSADERVLLGSMIRRSDNDAASRVFDVVGTEGLSALAVRAGMRRFTPNAYWGFSGIAAGDQTRFFLRIDRLIVRRHRAYAMLLLRTITPVQRWGIALVRPSGWRLYFKGGWGDTGWVDHQVALLTRGDERVAVAILTHDNGSHRYGNETLRGMAARLLDGLASAKEVP